MAARLVPAPDGWAGIALVQTIAGPLAGDRSRLVLEVGPGAALAVQSVAATVALPHRRPARQDVVCRVGRGGRLRWLAAPLVLADGCRLERDVDVDLADGACAVLGEVLVLGRHGEAGGRLQGRLTVDLAGRPLLREGLELDGADPDLAGPAVLDGARAYGAVALLGRRPPPPADPAQLDLDGEGAIVRVLAADAAQLTRRLAPVAERYAAAVEEEDRDDGGPPPLPPLAQPSPSAATR